MKQNRSMKIFHECYTDVANRHPMSDQNKYSLLVTAIALKF